MVGRGGTILRTINGGTKWDSLSCDTKNDLWDVCFTDINTGTVVAGWGFGGDHGGEILRTTDGGITWVQQLSDYTAGLHSVALPNSKTGFAVGADGTILRTKTGGVTLIDESLNPNRNISNYFDLQQNYPNPFNPVTKINYQLPMTSDVELIVYNLLGQRVTILVSENQLAGSYQFEWDATGFASGIYYYRIEAGNFQDVKKMIIIK